MDKPVKPVGINPIAEQIPLALNNDSDVFADDILELGVTEAGARVCASPTPMQVSFLSQLRWTIHKNILLISRNPFKLFFMIFSSVFSVLLAWPVCNDYPDEYYFPAKVDQCGVVEMSYYKQAQSDKEMKMLLTLNDKWRNGFAVSVIALGPFIVAACSFLLVHDEIEKKLLGVLRGLGVRETVFWMSWYLPLATLALLNSLLGASVAQLLPIHAFQTIYFGGVFASLFFLQLALISASFLLAAVCGANNKLLILLLLVMAISVFVPTFVNASIYPISVSDVIYDDYPSSFSGLLWTNRNTMADTYNYDTYNYDGDIKCNYPIMNEEQGTHYKTEEESEEITPDEFFIGCFVQPSFTSAMWSLQSGGSGDSFSLFVLYMIPYFHFMTIYSNFLGYTAFPGNEFDHRHSAMSPEKLAISAMSNSPNEINANGTSLFPQGSTILTNNYDDWDALKEFRREHGYDDIGYYYYYDSPGSTTCPSQKLNGFNLCESSSCDYGKRLSGSPSVHDMIGYLFSLSIIYIVLALYWSQIFPAGNGNARRFYFFLDRRYWFGTTVKENSDEPENNEIVSMKNISKSFGSCKAIKDLSLELKRGQINALLGHNGAGKSTLTNILSCEITPSKGEVSIFGRSLDHNSYDIQRMIGICKQDDFLWPYLSAKEHLDIFAGLRGVDSTSHDEKVMKWLESVDLAMNQHMFSSAFSGGMKRRLSVALSTIGDRPFLILDEPTTGMDPVSRRFVWQHIEDIRENRVILLTTHAMEEADLLADEVAIMKKGELAALGSPLELKTNHGSAIQFSILVEKDHLEESENSIKEIFQDKLDFVTIVGNISGNITVTIKKVQNKEDGESDGVKVSSLSNFVGWLENEDSNVSEYGFSNSSLEEVFINITRGEEEAESSNTITASDEAAFNESPVLLDNEEHISVEQSNYFSSFQSKLSVFNQVKALLYFTFVRKWTGRRSFVEYTIIGIFTIGTVLVGTLTACLGDYVLVIILWQTVPVASLSIMLLSLIFPIYRDKATGLYHLMRTQSLMKSSYIIGTAAFAFINQFIVGFIILSLYYATPLFRETHLYTDGYYDYPKVGEIYGSHGITVNVGESDSDNLELTVVRTPGSFFQVVAIAFLYALSMPGAVFLSSIIPGNHKFALVTVGFSIVVAFLFPIILIVIWAYNAFQDYYYYDDYYDASIGNETNPIDACMHKMDPNDFCTDSFLNTKNLTPEYLLNCIGRELLDESSLLLLCTPSYASLLPQNGAFQLLAMTILSDIKFSSESMQRFQQMIPNDTNISCNGNICKFPYIQDLYREHLLYFCLGAVLLNIIGLGFFTLVWFPPSFVLKGMSMFSRLFRNNVGSIMEGIDGDSNNEVILEEVLTEKNEVKETVSPCFASDIESDTGKDQNNIDYEARNDCTDIPPIVMYDLHKVYPASGRTPAKVAVKSLNLQVKCGEILGLLGKNGSGKTTALKVLSASHKASSGIALVAGFDVSCEKLQVFENLGNCPQFDVVWPFMAVGEHLEFFARLKGLPSSDIKDAAMSIASAVGLGAPDVYERLAKNLSGGMRRRLSIAISFVGAPTVLLLDEPTTGLDPSTRNEVWGLISSLAMEERALIITTHMMLEADTLCNRIAIIGQGNLKVVGTQQHLKDKYGSGYILQLNLVQSTLMNQDRAMNFVRKRLHEEAVIDNKQAKTLRIHLPKDINLEKVFLALYSQERITEGCINQFLLSQSSLEDVFISLGSDATGTIIG